MYEWKDCRYNSSYCGLSETSASMVDFFFLRENLSSHLKLTQQKAEYFDIHNFEVFLIA